MKKFLALVLTVVMLFAMATTANADPSASWNAAKGTAKVDGQKDDVYTAAQEMKMDKVSDGSADGTEASAWAVWDKEAFYIFLQVKDKDIDGLSTNFWEKDGMEFRLENKDQMLAVFGSDGSYEGAAPVADVISVKTKDGYNVEFKVPYDTAAGKVKFTLQVNCTSAGARACTLHTNEDLKDAWQNDEVFETLVFSSAAIAPKTEKKEVTAAPQTTNKDAKKATKKATKKTTKKKTSKKK